MSENKRLNMGLIGAGVWGETHAYLYEEDEKVNLKAVCDLEKEKAEKLAAKFDISHIYTEHQQMLTEMDLDAVAVVTPDFTHPPLVEDCARAGKDILLEKPMATTAEGVERCLKAVRENEVRMMVDLHNRWSPPFAIAKERIESGEIGEVISGYFRLNDIKWVATDMLSWADKSSILWFLGSHTVDTLCWLFNDEVEKVYSVSHKG
ncbi:MAG: Gfo/Idh/MocA family protein, partial [Bacillota bacterium]